MKNRIWDASYARGLHLVNRGCSLPYLNELPDREHFHQRDLYVREIGGCFESYAIDWGTSTGYAIALRVGTDRSSAIITRYCLLQPWPEHKIEWGCEPKEVLPKDRLDVYEYLHLTESRLAGILDERRLLQRGRPVDGLLCGFARQPIPASHPWERPAIAEISLVDGYGKPARSPVSLTIYRAIRQERRMSESTGHVAHLAKATDGHHSASEENGLAFFVGR